jgi:hypothetical protein
MGLRWLQSWGYSDFFVLTIRRSGSFSLAKFAAIRRASACNGTILLCAILKLCGRATPPSARQQQSIVVDPLVEGRKSCQS